MVFQKGHKTNLGRKWLSKRIKERKGELNPVWKGRRVGKKSLHQWINKNLQKSEVCEICKKDKKLEWSNKDHKYKSRERKDWQSVCRSCHTAYDYKFLKRTRVKTKPRKGMKKRAVLKKNLDKIFSLYIRLKYADSNGKVKCYTCPRFFHYTKIQNGHFISRSYLATRFDEQNCRPQCVGCNMFAGGRFLDFEEHLIKEIGLEQVTALKAKRSLIVRPDFEHLISLYKQKIDKLLAPNLLE